MSPVPSCEFLLQPNHCVLDLGDFVNDKDMECDLPEEDFLQQLSNDLEIPMLLEESLQTDREIDSLFEASSFFKEFDDDWGMDPVFHKAPDMSPQISLIKEEIKLEPDTVPSSPSSLSHDSWSSTDTKNFLETPPTSPPNSSSGSPPRTPTPPSNCEPPVLNYLGKPIKIVPLKHNVSLSDCKTKKVVLPKQISTNVILQPKPLNVKPLTVNGESNGQKTLVLSANDFNALTNQMAVNSSSAPTKIRIIQPMSTTNIKSEPCSTDKQDIHIKALKRQQRMIKNRESACLSRKKKKEYITSLEQRISDLEKENIQLKCENEALRARLGHNELTFRKRPKGAFTVNIKKTVVLAVLLVVSVNIGSISFFSRGSGADAVLSVPNIPISGHSGRRLLWSDSDLQTLNSSSSPKLQYNQQPTCPLHINQTESLRLNSELRRWIGAEKPVYNNESENESSVVGLHERLRKEGQLIVRPPPSLVPRQRRKIKLTKKEDHELQLLIPHAGLLEALHRRDDTFYVVSFSGDHLLLPALAHNNSVRPKMSLVLPALPFNTTMDSASSVTMMQIDCEVLDTRLVELSERDIPPHLRQTKMANKNTPHKNISDEEEPVRSSYRPYFLRSNSFVDPYSPLQRGPQDHQRFP